MSAPITVNDFKWIKGKNDLEYIRLLQDALDRQKQITSKAVAKIKELSAQNSPTQMSGTSPQRNTGHWIYGEHDVAMADGYRCDQCGFFIPWDYHHKFIDFIKDYHYCPSCGNLMEEGEQHE